MSSWPLTIRSERGGVSQARDGFLFFLLSFSFAACATPQERFWKWFAAHDAVLSAVKTGSEPICDELQAELRKVQEGLAFEFGPDSESQREFVVSADGDRELFPMVEKLVSSAPSIPHWRIFAFRQRRSTDFAVQVGGNKLGVDDVRIRTQMYGARVNLSLFVSGLTQANNDVMSRAVFLLLDSVLGEYDVETRIGGIEVGPSASAPADAIGLRELPARVDAMKH